MKGSGNTIKQIVQNNNSSEQEAKWLEKMYSMIFTLRKHIRLSEKK